MAAPPSPIQLRQEDFPEGIKTSEHAGQLLLPLANFTAATAAALNGQLSVSQNLMTQVVPISFTTPATDWITVPPTAFPSFGGSIRFRIDSTGVCHLSGTLTTAGASVGGSIISGVNSPLPQADKSVSFGVTVTSAGGVSPGVITVTQGAGFSGAGLTGTWASVTVTAITLDNVHYTPVNSAPAVLSCFPFKAQTTISNPSLINLSNLVGNPITQPNRVSSSAPPQTGYGTVKYHTQNRNGVGSGSVIIVDNIPGCALNTRYTGKLLVFQ